MLTHHLLNTLSDLVLKFSQDGTCVQYLSSAELSNAPPEVFQGRKLHDLIPATAADAGMECLVAVAQDGKTRTFEYSIESPTGPRYFEGLIAKSDDDRFLLIVRDMQARKLAQFAAEESERRFRIMADNAPAMLWMAGLNGDCEFFNKVWLTFTGRTLEEEIGTGWAEGIHFEDFQGCMSNYLNCFVQRREFRMEYRLRDATGQFRWILDQGVPRYSPDGSFAGFIGSCIDITDAKLAALKLREDADTLTSTLVERNALLEKLEQRSQELARSNSELEQFVYAASHDLRAPLRAIHMLSEWLQADLAEVNKPEITEQLQLLRTRVARMTNLLDDLLAYSRVGRSTNIVRQVDTRLLLVEIVESLAPPQAFAVDLSNTLPTLETPVGPIKQVFMNLITNAITHHDRPVGRIEVAAADRSDFVEFIVSDDGPGIPREYHDKVFQVFQTLNPRDRVEGSGVGLALVKKSVQTAGGTIDLESEGRGSTFRFTWPKRWHQS